MQSLSAFLLLASSFLAVASPTWTLWDRRPSVVVGSGSIVGVTTTFPESKIKVYRFLGLPFAAPPVRFQPAESPQSWSEPYDASEYKPPCFQQFNYPEDTRNLSMSWWNTPPPPAGESEDCLNLDIWAPTTKGKGKAVMVWLHGGSLRIGFGSLSCYDETTLAANEDIFIVTINYRAGEFGFPGSSKLPHTGNNLGFLYQRSALSWVQRNIAAFGGDPDPVTIAGESAGSGSVNALLFTPPDPLTFSAAIMESGTYSYNFLSPSPFRFFAALAALANCTGPSNITCQQSQPVFTLKSLVEHNALDFSPIIDNVIIAPNPPQIESQVTLPLSQPSAAPTRTTAASSFSPSTQQCNSSTSLSQASHNHSTTPSSPLTRSAVLVSPTGSSAQPPSAREFSF